MTPKKPTVKETVMEKLRKNSLYRTTIPIEELATQITNLFREREKEQKEKHDLELVVEKSNCDQRITVLKADFREKLEGLKEESQKKLLDWGMIVDELSRKVGKKASYENSRKLNLLYKDIKKFRDKFNQKIDDLIEEL